MKNELVVICVFLLLVCTMSSIRAMNNLSNRPTQSTCASAELVAELVAEQVSELVAERTNVVPQFVVPHSVSNAVSNVATETVRQSTSTVTDTTYLPQASFSDLINIETQQGSDNAFTYVGNMRNITDNKIVKIFGRYRRRGEYEYYAQHEDIRTQLVTKNREQLNDGDKINIPVFSDSPFTVYLHRNDYNMYNTFAESP